MQTKLGVGNERDLRGMDPPNWHRQGLGIAFLGYPYLFSPTFKQPFSEQLWKLFTFTGRVIQYFILLSSTLVMTKLASCIENLQSRIMKHRGSLCNNELRTRISLIDPLLRALGWDVSDPGVVILEYSIDKMKADYALLGEDSKPVAILETKKLGSDLSYNHRMQMLTYASSQGIAYAGLSNGDAWELYDVFKQAALSDSKILDLSIEKSPAYHAALQLLCLWRPNLGSGNVTHAKVPIIERNKGRSKIDPKEWVSLADYEPPSKAPVSPEALFWDGTKKELNSWRDMVKVTVKVLYEANLLTESNLPYNLFGGKKYLISTEPRHSNGTPFKSSWSLPESSLHMNLHLSAKEIRRCCRKLLEDFGKNPKTDMHLRRVT